MIKIGLTGWGDHPTLYDVRSKYRLTDYSSFFPVVEHDATFYAIPSASSVTKWLNETPASFQFIVKAYQGMTGHLPKEESPYQSVSEMFEQFRLAMTPMKEAGKLAFILFQFPPWFVCNETNARVLYYIRKQYPTWPVAIEFRHQSWFQPFCRGRTLATLKQLQFIHTICDEPQVGEKCVPRLLEVTNEQVAFFRFHGRHEDGWENKFPTKEMWRKVRYLYNYSEEELQQLAKEIEEVNTRVETTYVIFNNNSGHHAASNAQRMQQILNITYDNLASQQLNLFD